MKTITLEIGSPEWQKARSASKAPAMMGCSKYMTRSELIRQMATGLKEDVDKHTQARFDSGHASEEAAREIAEDILCDGLSPMSGSTDDGYLTASFDGLTFGGDIAWEHKVWNEELAASVRDGIVPDAWAWQMDQQILVGSLDYVLFMVSNGTREKYVTTEYRTTQERISKLLAGWKQLDEDVANYQHVEVKQAAVAAPVRALPTLFVKATGAVTESNMPDFKEQISTYLAGLNMAPTTDQEFADSKEIAKSLRDGAKAAMARKEDMLAQTLTIGEVAKDIDHIAKMMNESALKLEKAVATEEENRKLRMIARGRDELAAHMAALNKRLATAIMPAVEGKFAEAIKSKRLLPKMEEAINDEVARCKLISSEIADKMQINIAALDEAGHAFLFSDRATLLMKATDDLALVIKVRVSDHEAAEAKRLEAEREKIAAEERAKIEREQAAKQEAERKAQAAACIANETPAFAPSKATTTAAAQQEVTSQVRAATESVKTTTGYVLTHSSAAIAENRKPDSLMDALNMELMSLSDSQLQNVIDYVRKIKRMAA